MNQSEGEKRRKLNIEINVELCFQKTKFVVGHRKEENGMPEPRSHKAGQTCHLLAGETFLLLDRESMAVLARGVVERATLETRVMKLTVGSILIDIVAIGFVAAHWLEFAQR